MITTAEESIQAARWEWGGRGRNVTIFGQIAGLISPEAVCLVLPPGVSSFHFWSRRFRTVPHHPRMLADLREGQTFLRIIL